MSSHYICGNSNWKTYFKKENKLKFFMYVEILEGINTHSRFRDKEWESTCLYRHIQISLLKDHRNILFNLWHHIQEFTLFLRFWRKIRTVHFEEHTVISPAFSVYTYFTAYWILVPSLKGDTLLLKKVLYAHPRLGIISHYCGMTGRDDDNDSLLLHIFHFTFRKAYRLS